MRTAFIETLMQMATEDPRITLMVGDLGFGVVTDFAKRFPDQFLNAPCLKILTSTHLSYLVYRRPGKPGLPPRQQQPHELS